MPDLNCADALTAAGIEAYIKTSGVFRVEVRRKVTSTNALIRESAAAGAPEGHVIAAEEQTAGKGRQGRSFYSPAGHGVYFSLLLRPGCTAGEAVLITPAAAVAVALAIEEVYGVRTGIKWVNDLYADGKKVCGILTETVIGAESRLVESAILGIGVNITEPEEGYPDEIKAVASALTDRSGGESGSESGGESGDESGDESGRRCRLIAAILDNFWGYYKPGDGSASRARAGQSSVPCPAQRTVPGLMSRGFLDEYRARSIVTGRDVFVLAGGGRRAAKAIAVDDDCGLVVQYESGETVTLTSGEVSIRAIDYQSD